MESAKNIKDPIEIEVTLIKETAAAWYLDCDGDEEWFPKSLCSLNGNTLTVPKWIYKEKFPEDDV